MRLFLYLDQYKLYSFSSQLFRGLVDHIVNESQRRKKREETPASANATARVVAEIAAENSTVSEKRFLHDYAYDLFENELVTRGALLDVSANVTMRDFEQPGFIRVSGPAVFADAPRIRETVAQFNKLAEALAYVTKGSELQQERRQLEEQAAGTNDRNVRSRIKELSKTMNRKALAEAAGLHQDQEYLSQLSFLLDYGYGDQLQVQIPYAASEGQLLFSACLHRQSLRESEHLLLQKYSRLTDRALVVVGVPTQTGGVTAEKFNGGDGTLRAAMAEMYSNMTGLEATFAGRLDREVVVDPVAVYIQWELGAGADVPGG